MKHYQGKEELIKPKYMLQLGTGPFEKIMTNITVIKLGGKNFIKAC